MRSLTQQLVLCQKSSEKLKLFLFFFKLQCVYFRETTMLIMFDKPSIWRALIGSLLYLHKEVWSNGNHLYSLIQCGLWNFTGVQDEIIFLSSFWISDQKPFYLDITLYFTTHTLIPPSKVPLCHISWNIHCFNMAVHGFLGSIFCCSQTRTIQNRKFIISKNFLI